MSSEAEREEIRVADAIKIAYKQGLLRGAELRLEMRLLGISHSKDKHSQGYTLGYNQGTKDYEEAIRMEAEA